MHCTTQDIVDAIITAGVRRGTDGRGKDGLDGRMFMLARTDREGFGILLVAALRLKMKAKPERWAACKEFLTVEEIKAELRERGLPQELLKELIKYDPNNLPAELCMDAQPNGTRELMEATINAAIRHGSDGHGKDGLVGYMLVLQRTEFKTFVRLMELAQQWQVKQTAQSDKPQPTEEELERTCWRAAWTLTLSTPSLKNGQTRAPSIGTKTQTRMGYRVSLGDRRGTSPKTFRQ
jgi:hypothetical protein